MRTYFASSSHLLSMIKFGIVGAMTATLYFLVMWLANSLFRLNYIASISIAYFISTTFHFLANRHFTFDAAKERQHSQIFRYLVMWVLNYLITIAIVSICVETLMLSAYLGVCISVVFTVLTGYFLSRFWVFKVTRSNV